MPCGQKRRAASIPGACCPMMLLTNVARRSRSYVSDVSASPATSSDAFCSAYDRLTSSHRPFSRSSCPILTFGRSRRARSRLFWARYSCSAAARSLVASRNALSANSSRGSFASAWSLWTSASVPSTMPKPRSVSSNGESTESVAGCMLILRHGCMRSRARASCTPPLFLRSSGSMHR